MGRTQSRAERLTAMETFLYRSPADGRKVNNIILYHPDNSVTLCLHLLFVKMAKGHLKPFRSIVYNPVSQQGIYSYVVVDSIALCCIR